MMEQIAVTAVAATVLARVVGIVSGMSRDAWRGNWRYHLFAAGYAVLGGATLQVLVDVWRGPIDWHGVAFVVASAMLILGERRKGGACRTADCPKHGWRPVERPTP